MTWNSAERGLSDRAISQGVSAQDDTNDRSNLSASLWKPSLGCGKGGCSCGNCNRSDRSSSADGATEGWKKIGGAIGNSDEKNFSIDNSAAQFKGARILEKDERGIGSGIGASFSADPEMLEKRLDQGRDADRLGNELDIPTLWTNLHGTDQENQRPENGDSNRTVTVSNGDQLTLGGRNGFELRSKDGEPIEIVDTKEPMATDMPREHVLSNGAIYRSRGGFNHDESITWPNGDVVRFSDSGKFESYESKNDPASRSNGEGAEQAPDTGGENTDSKPHRSDNNDSAKDSYVFDNGDQFVSTGHGWKIYTADGELVTKGTPDPDSPSDATRIPLSNGATLISGGWGIDTIRYPSGETISFSKDGDLR